jgi:hypothetical protein
MGEGISPLYSLRQSGFAALFALITLETGPVTALPGEVFPRGQVVRPITMPGTSPRSTQCRSPVGGVTEQLPAQIH